MIPPKFYTYTIILLLLIQFGYGCNNKPASNTSSVTVVKTVKKDSVIVKEEGLTDEQQFRQFLKQFKDAVKTKSKTQLVTMFHFPLQTLPQWTNDELNNTTVKPQEGLISQNEFPTYFDDIFTKDAVKLIPASGENDLSEIDKTTTENYYKTLQQATDKGSTLYELQKQYTEDNGKETSFGFVFGKIGGKYKAISYYRPWPLK
ncbi:hypothetical protein [Mucilaginibacter jinjuensis]|uniref:Lipoprotein n=1 Tax=Mucilaginibacter jinjuensis TaxID=1176721 RepID=A0ABY7T5D1_9SPHI|nr:hypothetical protein [Mucilaginibacter jinjuensis]WCT10462.1 hypothetical protein PQO05_17130 [Mucilaginibacter jinjuensis]